MILLLFLDEPTVQEDRGGSHTFYATALTSYIDEFVRGEAVVRAEIEARVDALIRDTVSARGHRIEDYRIDDGRWASMLPTGLYGHGFVRAAVRGRVQGKIDGVTA